MNKQPITAYKAFNADWSCRDHQYEVGSTYKMEGAAKICEHGFHACLHPLDVLSYYPAAGSKFAVVELPDIADENNGDTKICGVEISIKAELHIHELIEAAIKHVFDSAKWLKKSTAVKDNEAASATGDSGAASATGTRGAASATGYSGAASATGDSGAASATGTHGAASATGTRGAASATGDSGAASATGDSGAAMASGRDGMAMGAEGCALFLCERDDNWNIVAVWAGIVGRDGIKPLVWYMLQDGKPVEVTQ